MKHLAIFIQILFFNSQLCGQTISGFRLDVKNLPAKSSPRISMIGFKARTFTLDQLLYETDTIRLEKETYSLPEVLVNPGGKVINAGTASFSFKNDFCG